MIGRHFAMLGFGITERCRIYRQYWRQHRRISKAIDVHKRTLTNTLTHSVLALLDLIWNLNDTVFSVKSGDPMSTKTIIISQMQQIAQEQNRKLAPLTDDLVLLEFGLELA